MAEILGKPSTGSIIALAAVAVGGIIGARYLSTRKVSAAERLADALLDTEPLRDAARHLADKPEQRLAACATYILDVCNRASGGWRLATGGNDPIGYSRTQIHTYTQAVATVLTEAHTPDHVLTYSITIPDVGEVRGTRKVGPLHMNGLVPAYATPDTAQITLQDGYTAQLESELNMTEGFVTGKPHLFGAITLRDDQGNVGRLNVGSDGSVNGTITRESHIVGRFEGRLKDSVRFLPYQIEKEEN